MHISFYGVAVGDGAIVGVNSGSMVGVTVGDGGVGVGDKSDCPNGEGVAVGSTSCSLTSSTVTVPTSIILSSLGRYNIAFFASV